MADTAQLGIEAVRMLGTEILPLVDDGAGKLGVVTLTVPAEEADAVVEDLYGFLKERWAKAAAQSGPVDVLVVLGVGQRPSTQPGTRGDSENSGQS